MNAPGNITVFYYERNDQDVTLTCLCSVMGSVSSAPDENKCVQISVCPLGHERQSIEYQMHIYRKQVNFSINFIATRKCAVDVSGSLTKTSFITVTTTSKIVKGTSHRRRNVCAIRCVSLAETHYRTRHCSDSMGCKKYI